MHFNWAPANRIRGNLHLRTGVIGEFREKIEAGGDISISAARTFAKEYRDRSAIMALAEKIDRGTVVKYKTLDGAARERLVSAFEDLAALCAEYVDAADAASSARTSSQKTLVQRVAQAVGAGADKAVRALAAFAETAPPLPAAAAAFAMAALTRLKDASHGRFAQAGIHDHLLAVHGPLLWIPDLHYGTSWLPSPYRAEAIVTALLDTSVPPQSRTPDDDAFRTTVNARLLEGSFIAARLLIQAGGFYGIDDETRAALADGCDANLSSCRADLKDSMDDTRRLIDKVQRMGSLVRIDQANAVFAALDRINPDTLPSDVSLEARVEDEEPEQIMDFGSARDQIADVRDRVSHLLDGPRDALLHRLDALQGRAREGDISRVREIISTHDDLVTAGEYISFMEEGGGLPERPFANRRFHAFFPHVPDALAKAGKHALEAAQTAVESGRDLPALPFSHVPAERRSEVLETLEAWRDLRRRVERNDQAGSIQPLLDRLFTAVRMAPVVRTPAIRGQNMPPKTYVAEFHLNIPEDKASMLLPDFGSLTEFNYRIAVAPNLPSEGELTNLCQDAGNYGVIVLVTSLIEVDRRRQLQVACLGQNRRVLVIDEAILLYALTEPEFRPLTMIECAQPFSFAAPYKDYGNAPVPPEMFFGRETEIRKIADRMGSCIVYGGRRLGKTALLRHIKEQHSDPQRNGSTAVGYANIRDIGATPSRVWDAASRDLTAIFNNAPVKTAAEFTIKVQAWLKGDSKRRVLLLLDETDYFIDGDSKQHFSEFHRLQELMDSTYRRFKVVLAGLHNVTRIVRTENSPLKQIASDPQRIGPLMDEELPDAERLVTRPLSALGYEFKNRSDVWRILSHCNYYPVLVQTFCERLLAGLEKETVRRPKSAREITDRHVREAIENETIRKEIEAKFDYTIREIDRRYELITCVVAERALRDAQAGRVDEGMSTVEVLDAVATWWPAAFDHSHRLETVKDLLDEMVGLGVLRQTASGTWALRSHAILRLLGDEDHVTTRLLSFENRPPPPAFDPRSMRRGLTLPREAPDYPCPLTWGQEYDLFAGSAHISVVFGNALADVVYVSEALRTADPATADGVKVTVSARNFAAVTDMLDALRPLARSTNPTAVVIEPRTDWDVTWVEAATRQRAVREGTVRVVFVGGADHALCWVRNPRVAKLPQGVRIMLLQTWAGAYLEHELGDDNLPPERFAGDLKRITGGFNRPMSLAVTGFNGSPDRFAKHLKGVETRLNRERDLLTDLGLAPPMAELFRCLSEWADPNGRIGLEEIRDGVGDVLESLNLTAAQVTEFGAMMGVLEPQAARPGEPADSRVFVMSPLVRVALAQAQAKAQSQAGEAA